MTSIVVLGHENLDYMGHIHRILSAIRLESIAYDEIIVSCEFNLFHSIILSFCIRNNVKFRIETLLSSSDFRGLSYDKIVIFPNTDKKILKIVNSKFSSKVISEKDMMADLEASVNNESLVQNSYAVGSAPHINVYSKSNDELGRFLSNFSHFDKSYIYENHSFNSIESLWFYLKTSPNDPLKCKFPNLSGLEAKMCSKLISEYSLMDFKSFAEVICRAIHHKITSSHLMCEKFINSSLPFSHYYQMYGRNILGGHFWILRYLEELRRVLKSQKTN